MPADRTIRIAQEMKKTIGVIISSEIKDPRISPMTSVMKVELTRDLKYAKVYVSVYDKEEVKKSTIEALTHAQGYIKKLLGERIDMRRMPSIKFVLDDSIDASINIAKILKDIGVSEEK